MTIELGKLKQPRFDNNALMDIISGLVGYQAVVVAHQIKIFELLKTHPLTLQQVAKALHIADRPAEAIIIANVALGLLRKIGSKYALAPIGQEYLLEDSPTYFGALFDLIANNPTSIESVRLAVVSNSPQTYGGEEVFNSHKEDIGNAKAFTRAMHSISMAPALVWPSSINLSAYSCLLDIGGGSGAHAIGALRQWPQLTGIVFDIEPVCEVATEYIRKYKLGSRMRTQTGDLWKTPFPVSDVHFYSQIYHDWPLEKC
ncbi:MAG: acetylserotonin O-methyltransferase, partial [Nitrososphaera sp.]|nr:acetylserotonin O-methyltransferase [Nitrososphaera sp.]